MDVPLDIRTTFLFGTLIGVLLVAAMGFVRLRLSTYEGFGFWIASVLAFLGAVAFLALAGPSSSSPLIPLTNLFHVASLVLALWGMTRFFGQRISGWLVWGPLAAVTSGSVYFTWLVPDRHLRILVASGSLLVAVFAALRVVSSTTSGSPVGRTS